MTTEAAIIAVAEANNVALIMKVIVDWDDDFDLPIVPAITAEQGFALAKPMQADSAA
jgi:hypothetical protein